MGKASRNRADKHNLIPVVKGRGKSDVMSVQEGAARSRKLGENAAAAGPYSDAHFRKHGSQLVRRDDGSTMEIKSDGRRIIGKGAPMFNKNGWIVYVAYEMQNNGPFDAAKMAPVPTGELFYEKRLKEAAETGGKALGVPLRDSEMWLYGVGPDWEGGYRRKMEFFRFVLTINKLEVSNENMSNFQDALEFFASHWRKILGMPDDDGLRENVNQSSKPHLDGGVNDDGGQLDDIPG
ncbi:MAG: hypothetical protein ACR2PR_09125 [Pseudohongiellaceae bacterium]